MRYGRYFREEEIADSNEKKYYCRWTAPPRGLKRRCTKAHDGIKYIGESDTMLVEQKEGHRSYEVCRQHFFQPEPPAEKNHQHIAVGYKMKDISMKEMI